MDAQELLDRYARGERRFIGANLRGANLRKANLEGVNLENSDLRGAHLEEARLSAANLIAANLEEANLCDSILYKADFQTANLLSAHLERALLAEANIKWANLRIAHLENASLYNANLTGANLTGANLTGTNLIFANFMDAQIDECQFGDATLGNTQLLRIDLAPFFGVTLSQREPSIIDYVSIVKSYNCPNLRRFLVNAGMPQVFVDYMIDCARSLSPSQRFSLMLSTFISYGRPDEPFALRLNQALKDSGVHTFFYPKDAKLGEWNANVMYRGIREYDRVVAICSKLSLSRPGFRTELNEARRKEAATGGESCVIPITIDDYVFGEEFKATDSELANFLLERVVGDFCNANEDDTSFDASFPRLLDALRKRIESTAGVR